MKDRLSVNPAMAVQCDSSGFAEGIANSMRMIPTQRCLITVRDASKRSASSRQRITERANW
jgi:hypothetical protein